MKGVLYFVAGAVAGSAVTYIYVNKKIKDQADQEIEAVREIYKEKLANELKKMHKGQPDENPNPKKVIEEKAKKEVDLNNKKLEEIILNNNYQTGVDMADEETESQQVEETYEEEASEDDSDYIVQTEELPDVHHPYIITEEEFGEFGNEERTLIFYSDSILADDDDDEIVDPESVIGNALEEFNDPAVERVFVRDEDSEIDYTILRSEKLYSEVCSEEEN